jgi:hypothetical protein
MYEQNKCAGSFHNGKQVRLRHPLRKGRYKLEEVASGLIRCRLEIVRISEVINRVSDGTKLMYCTNSDKALWLAGVPDRVAFTLGYEFLPGLEALQNEGVSELTVSRVYAEMSEQCNSLVFDLELARVSIYESIKNEYRQMRNGRSLLVPLVDDALSMTKQVLLLADIERKTDLRYTKSPQELHSDHLY